ncbi:TRAP transporter substrate-binding protein DctP [Afifella sp. H1R]|uniref:TRAP transporter substrate-binding protein DctP n=1 Tax=Afifella sp. H1R TaxID=2908841 RepID=UPI001F25FB76|nr:TRAP transporter substrate-binding protein DctP [Afifella sp. H1R]MCF1505010.1 TRAP transporter substrate-binding protein DctP [Afifella sp. H1R]
MFFQRARAVISSVRAASVRTRPVHHALVAVLSLAGLLASEFPAAAAMLRTGQVTAGGAESFSGAMIDELERALQDEKADLVLRRLATGEAGDGKPEAFEPEALWDRLATGRVDVAALPLAAATSSDPIFGAASMPGLARRHADADALARSAFMADLKTHLDNAGMIVLADAWLAGGFVSSGACLDGPPSTSGKTLHAEGEPLRTVLTKSGASVARAPRARLAAALAGGVIDGALASSSVLADPELARAAECLTAPGSDALWFSYEPIVIARPSWEALSEDERAALKAAGEKVTAWAARESRAQDDRLVQMYRKAGATVEEMPRSALDQWLAVAVESSWRDFARDVKDGKRLLAEAITGD